MRAMHEAVLAVAGETAVEPILQRLVHAARELAGARYAAIGVPDDADPGAFARFLVSGLTDEEIEAIGPLPRTHGLLGAQLCEPDSYRTGDIRRDPRFWGWPQTHPEMRSFLGVPILAGGDIIGAFYLTDKVTAEATGFSADDERLVELLAAHAAVAIEHARLLERSREAALLEERERLARELHDAMTQTLFSLRLAAESAAALLADQPAEAATQILVVRELAGEVMRELRALIDELRPGELVADGLAPALTQHVALLRRAHGVEVELRVLGERRLAPASERAVLRVLQEALGNALRHAGASRVEVRLDLSVPGVRASVRDDGVGFDPAARRISSRRLGLTSMRERARALGGTLSVDSTPGAGTVVRMELPDA